MTATEVPGSQGALHGVTVVDLTRHIAGPVCTQFLADMGAEVIKVESPDGDPSRYNAPLKGDRGGFFPAFNRNKKSITLDLRAQSGNELLLKLLERADVLVENFRPGTMERMGLGYARLRTMFPRLVMTSISGFGQSGPSSSRPAFDGVIQATSGMMSETRSGGGPPRSVGAPIGDVSGGLVGALGTLVALFHQQASGKGQHVDASMYESILFYMAAQTVIFARRVPGPASAVGLAPMGTFPTRDGRYVNIMAQDNNHWPLLARLMKREDLTEDPEYQTRAARAARGEELNTLVRDWVSSLDAADVTAALESGGVPYGLVKDIEEVLEDKHARTRNSIVDVDHDGEIIPLVGIVPKLSATPGAVRTAAPHVGEHNEEIYSGMMGLSEEEIERLRGKHFG